MLPATVLEIVFWLLGSLQDRSFEHVWLLLPLTALSWLLLFACARRWMRPPGGRGAQPAGSI
ncbi:MAG: hypothetical protein U1F68_08610 [Gammaproteobacteria bacterium]